MFLMALHYSVDWEKQIWLQMPSVDGQQVQ